MSPPEIQLGIISPPQKPLGEGFQKRGVLMGGKWAEEVLDERKQKALWKGSVRWAEAKER